MKIKLSKSQWEGIGKKAGWDGTYKDPLPQEPILPTVGGNKDFDVEGFALSTTERKIKTLLDDPRGRNMFSKWLKDNPPMLMEIWRGVFS